ncbi:glycoside hydrolase family 15 protein [Macrolepiota fuliginosa MF-IS2]|uniref:Glycoside hydrolase family 15 protein n=1 Tax=Macrolepiota fuliginosa MF-IS2 TaxID=1400762 RepID=A0A9P5XD24_9AGAR|nr:glycoside hydrolase family 15 protein [Macrolepiota fuliginosa MF-IS2]
MSYYQPSHERGYLPIADHGLIGNLRTAAFVSLDGSVESYCVPNFDSPSVFARILDKDKGGHFSIQPTIPYTSKQNYLPSSNVLQTKFMNDIGVVSVTDFLPRPRQANDTGSTQKPLLPWLIRRVECIRGSLTVNIECAPAFNYARNPHVTSIVDDESIPPIPGFHKQKKALFESADITLDLRYVPERTMEDTEIPVVHLTTLDLSAKGHKGLAVQAFIQLVEGQAVTFILRNPPNTTCAYTRVEDLAPRVELQLTPEIPQIGIIQAPGAPGGAGSAHARKVDAMLIAERDVGPPALVPRVRALDDPFLTPELVHSLLHTTNRYWYDWIRQSTYTGSWKEAVLRSALALKLLIFEPTGAVVASPTFSLPEYIGGTRNWDYRYSWIRDSSFTLYALIRLGFTEEANAYLEFIFDRLRDKNPDGSLQIMYTIHGEKDIPEVELTHLDGHKGSKPVRIGNGAADHVQLDIYGELMDCIYLGQKHGKPLNYDDWVMVRGIVDFVVAHYKDPDLSIWEVRNRERNFTYSKVMLWVAIDRGLRLADKRSLPCPNRFKWLAARDELYEEIMELAWNKEGKFFGQSYEETHVLDSAVLIMPLVFFMQASDPRFVNTLKQILRTPDKGGLTSNNLVYRYDTRKSEDGVGGEEGTFCLCTLWCVEALTRAGQTDRTFLPRAISMFEDFLLYLNHVGLCSEEISDSGESLGNAVQGFTHVTLISAAYNLSRTLNKGSV